MRTWSAITSTPLSRSSVTSASPNHRWICAAAASPPASSRNGRRSFGTTALNSAPGAKQAATSRQSWATIASTNRWPRSRDAERGSVCCMRLLEVAALLLLAFDRLEEGLEVADSEAPRSVSLDDLEEECRPILDRLGEDLEQVALLVPICLDSQLLEGVHRYANLADAGGERLVVRMRQAQELHSP